MLETVGFVFLNVFQFFKLSLSGPFLILCLSLDQIVKLVLFSLPSGKIFLSFTSKVSFGVFKATNLFIASLDFFFFEPDILSKFSNQAVFFSIFFLKTSNLRFKLFCF